MYVDLLSNYGPPGSEGNSFNEILALYNEGKCGMWVDATIAASFLEVDGVDYAQVTQRRQSGRRKLVVGMGDGSTCRFTER